MKEIWKSITGYEGLYEVSNLGRVKSLNYNHTGKERILKNLNRSNGYLYVELHRKKYSIHRLVASAFIENPDNLPCVNHIDCNPQNNKVSNLEWCTHQYNNTYNDRHIKAGIKLTKKVGCFKGIILIKIYNAVIDTEKDGFCYTDVISCCKGNRKSHKGYQWKYID